MNTAIAFIFAILILGTHQEKCYWQGDNGPDDSLTVCEGTAGSCCHENDACFQDGLCMSTQGFFYQGGCTTEGWLQGADGCFSQCDASLSGLTLAPVSPCPFANDTVKLCCGWAFDADTCCRDEKDGFMFDFPQFQGRLNSPVFKNIVASAEALGAASTVATTPATMGSLETATNAAFLSSHGYVKRSVPIGVGVALGIALIIALATVAWLSFRLRRLLAAESTKYYETEYSPDYKPPIEAGSNTKPFEIQDHPRYEVHGDDVAELYPQNGQNIKTHRVE